jgi:fructosamine-3-kinase
LNKLGEKFKLPVFLMSRAYWADFAREISFMEMFGLVNEDFYDIYSQKHKLDDLFRLRKDIYNLKMHLKHVMMYPDQYYYHEGAERCLRSVETAVN